MILLSYYPLALVKIAKDYVAFKLNRAFVSRGISEELNFSRIQ